MARPIALLPADAAPPPLPAGVDVRAYASAAEVVAALGETTSGVVLCSDGLSAAEHERAAAVAAAGAAVVEVRSASWDGETHSPLSAACVGVIAGFGLAGVSAAVDLLHEDG